MNALRLFASSCALGALSVFALACSSSERREGAVDTSAAALTNGADAGAASAALHFNADSVTTEGTLTTGRKLLVDYAVDRMPTCRGNVGGGGPGWSVTAFLRVNGGPISSFAVAGLLPGGPENTVNLPAKIGSSDVELWFQNTSMWGCMAWDSNYGQNFHFTAAPPPEAPDWVGEILYADSRATCGSGLCDSDRHPLSDGKTFRFDSWSRQRAAGSELTFRVYKAGVTDWDNANAWQDLDVQVHYRSRATAAFQTQYVSIDERQGNDLRYRMSVRPLDPFVSHGSNPPCPDADVTKDGVTAKVDVELYFTVNGVEIRPADSATDTFHGSFEDDASLWSSCFP